MTLSGSVLASPMQSSTSLLCGAVSFAQVTLAPLFVVQSCLPFDVNLRLLPQPLSASGRAEAFEVPGCGECSVLLGVRVDVVYHVTVCFEEG